MSQTINKLLPCPFCESDQIVHSSVWSSHEGRHVQTYECKGCHSFARVEKWNSRAAPRQPEGEGLEVVAWNITVKMDGRTWSEYTEKLPFLPDAKVVWHSEPEPVCRLSDAQRAIAELREEISDLHTTMMAAAVEIQAHWEAHCDEEGYGPANLMHRLERGIASQYGYTAQTLVQIEAERDTLRQQLAERDAEIEKLRGRLEKAWLEGDRLAMQGCELQRALAQRDKLAGLLREWRGMFDGGLASGQLGVLRGQTDAALAEVNK